MTKTAIFANSRWQTDAILKVVIRLDALALCVIAKATWLAGWLGGWLGVCHSRSGIVSKRLNLSENVLDHLVIVTIGLSRTVSEINGDVRRKSNENRQFSHPRVFSAPDERVPRGIWYRRKGY